jgi:hypothetical protein
MGIKKDNQGIAHPLFIVLAVVVLAAIGFAGYYVYHNNQSDKDLLAKSGLAKAEANTTDKSCNNALHDKTLCKFAVYFKMPSSYEATFTTTTSGVTSTTVMSVDSHNNTKMVVSSGGKETLATILLGSDTYLKDENSGSWIKYPNSGSSSNSSPLSDVKINKNNWTESGTMSYKALGKEACGSLTCYKYQISSTKDPSAKQYFWFDTKDYMIRRLSSTGGSSGNIDMTLSYNAVTITTPSPVVDYTNAPSSFDANSFLNQLQSATGTSTSQ